MTTLPRDSDNHAIQALRLLPQGAHAIETSATAAKNTTPFDKNTRIVSVYATGDVYMDFGDDSVIADTNAHYYPSGLYYDFAVGGDKTLHFTHLSVLAAEGDCMVYISEKQ